MGCRGVCAAQVGAAVAVAFMALRRDAAASGGAAAAAVPPPLARL